MNNCERTYDMKKRLCLDGKLRSTDEDSYEGRPIIHKDSPINGGVYLGKKEREAIVVDFEKFGVLRSVYENIRNRLARGIDESEVLATVYEMVAKLMPNKDKSTIKRYVRKVGREHDGKISLDTFVSKGIGVCRHKALACAAFLERLIKEGYLEGRVSIDRTSTCLGGHAWCRYTTPFDEIIILDVSNGYIGRLRDAPKSLKWIYEMPE